MKILWRSLLLCGLLSGSNLQQAQADWPEFRGPTGQGHAPGEHAPLTWSDTENVTWKKQIPGIAWSSPVVVDNRIYLTTAVEQPAPAEQEGTPDPVVDLGAICLDARTGEVIWQKEIFTQTGPVEIHKKNSHASPTAIVKDGAVYVHFGPHGTARLTTDGDLVWKQTLTYSPQHGNGGSPALAGDVLIISCDGHDIQYGVGLDIATGEIRWKKDRSVPPQKGFSFGTPLVIEVDGKQQAICTASEAVYALDPATGEEIWHVVYPGGYSVTPRPVYGKGLVFVCTGYQKPLLLAIDPTGHGDVTETHVRWKTDKNVPHSASLLLTDDRLYFVSDKGIARCVAAETGEGIWQERLGGNYSASPLSIDGRIYFQDEDGEAIVISNSNEFEVLARNKWADERTYASYAVSGNALFLRSENYLLRVEEKK